jgi:hypothetical protein
MIGGIIFVVFLVLKLLGILTWSWWWITAPLWIGFIIEAVIFPAIGGSILGIAWLWEKGKRGGRTTVGGIFAIIGGLFSLYDGIMLIRTEAIGGLSGEVAILSLTLGAIALIGGGFVFKRRRWGLALAGAICSLSSGSFELGATILGIPYRPIILILAILAIIFIALGKREFASIPVAQGGQE